MARKTTSKNQPNTPPSLDPAQASKLLHDHCQKGRQLLDNPPISSANNQAWETVTHDLLLRAFGSASPNIDRVMNVGRYEHYFDSPTEAEWEITRAKTMTTRLEILDGLVELLGSLTTSHTPSEHKEIGNTVFLVHGHDEAIIHETARLVERFELKVVILREQPNSGRTIIEKFIDYSDAAFAIILLTADDRGGTKSQSFEEQKYRARQNLILELGFFLGKLGRNLVCSL